jgi:hypothetical protein
MEYSHRKNNSATSKVTTDNFQFQVIMTLDDLPISTGGLYNHVVLLDKEPRFKIYKNWLALVYTIPKQRQKGYGALICKYIQEHSKKMGLKKCIYSLTPQKDYTIDLDGLNLKDFNCAIGT